MVGVKSLLLLAVVEAPGGVVGRSESVEVNGLVWVMGGELRRRQLDAARDMGGGRRGCGGLLGVRVAVVGGRWHRRPEAT